MRVKNKILLIAISFLILSSAIVIVGYYLTIPALITTPEKERFYVTIEGNVIPDEYFISMYESNPESYFSRRHNIVIIYNSPEYPQRPCEAKDLAVAPIKWENETFGTYFVRLDLLYPHEIFVDVTCAVCDVEKKLKIVDENSEKIFIDVNWTNNLCNEMGTSRLSDNIREQIKIVKNIGFSGMRNDVEKLDIEQSKKNEINEHIDKAVGFSDQLNDIKNYGSAYIVALKSVWHTEKAYLKIYYYNLESCVKNFDDLYDSYKDNLCYSKDYESELAYKSSNNTLNSYEDYINTKYRQPPDEIDDLKSDIRIFENTRDNILRKSRECEDKLELQNESFSFQSNYCKQRKIVLSLYKNYLYFVLIAPVLFIGLLLENRFKIIQKTYKESISTKNQFISKIGNLAIERKILIVIFFVFCIGAVVTNIFFRDLLGYLFIGFIAAVFTFLFGFLLFRMKQSKKIRKK